MTLGDQPFITSEVIRAALAQLDGHDAVRAMYDGKPGHPVVFGRAVMEAVAQRWRATSARARSSRASA